MQEDICLIYGRNSEKFSPLSDQFSFRNMCTLNRNLIKFIFRQLTGTMDILPTLDEFNTKYHNMTNTTV